MKVEGSATREKSIRTRERILVAAEQLFADKGFAGASMRDIMSAAGVNLSGAYYYFENKEKLLLAVFERLVLPLLEREAELLREARKRAGDNPIPFRDLIEATILPRVEGLSDTSQRLIALLFARQGEVESRIFSSLAKITLSQRQEFLKEYMRSSPGVSRLEVRFRVSSMNAMLDGFRTLAPLYKKHFSMDSTSKKAYIEMIVSQLIAMFSSPPTLPEDSE